MSKNGYEAERAALLQDAEVLPEGQDETYEVTANEEEQCWFVKQLRTGDYERLSTAEMVAWFNRVAVHGRNFKATVEATF